MKIVNRVAIMFFAVFSFSHAFAECIPAAQGESILDQSLFPNVEAVITVVPECFRDGGQFLVGCGLKTREKYEVLDASMTEKVIGDAKIERCLVRAIGNANLDQRCRLNTDAVEISLRASACVQFADGSFGTVRYATKKKRISAEILQRRQGQLIEITAEKFGPLLPE